MVIYHKTHISLFIENSEKLQCTGDEEYCKTTRVKQEKKNLIQKIFVNLCNKLQKLTYIHGR